MCCKLQVVRRTKKKKKNKKGRGYVHRNGVSQKSTTRLLGRIDSTFLLNPFPSFVAFLLSPHRGSTVWQIYVAQVSCTSTPLLAAGGMT